MTDTATDPGHPALQQRELGPTQDIVIEQAKGVLMLRYGIGSYESLATLAQWSHDAHLSLPEISRALVKGICQGHAGPRDRGVVRWLEHRLREEVVGVAASSGTAAPKPAVPASAVPGPDELEVEDRPEDRAASPVPDVAVLKRWRYASAVHAARALHRG